MPTKIQWCDESWNPITGCTKISEGCRHCYAERQAKRFAGRFRYPKDDPFRVAPHFDKVEKPYGWKKPKKNICVFDG
jgi:protein gp37